MADAFSVGASVCVVISVALVGLPSMASIMRPLPRTTAGLAQRWRRAVSALLLTAGTVLFVFWVKQQLSDARHGARCGSAEPLELTWLVLTAVLEFVGTSMAMKVSFCDLFLHILERVKCAYCPLPSMGRQVCDREETPIRPLELAYDHGEQNALCRYNP